MEEAERCFNRLAGAITNSCINWMPNYTKLTSQILQESDVTDPLSLEGGSHKTLDTTDLSEINFVYNNITFQLPYPGSNVTQKGSSETKIQPSENELDHSNISEFGLLDHSTNQPTNQPTNL